ncbi:cytochrome c oxidase subunit I [Chelativorans salis]|uniref:Cytochrome c oxidase subunit 1 n=1 Tax=Chelativorans salis TaxID=2978478 RepID=A0ABT2LNZ1_9HYPH|nr:cytochrome c oxidase subunit I [Chelativorans sp. EGI FJ00035]MCT7376280.1 cytochrome c oxidase subunit I [Chelativorans sp. EGI FJ00035]
MSVIEPPRQGEIVTRTPEELDRLSSTWESPGGLIGWFMPVNQRVIGRRFVLTAFVFFFLAGALAVLMRIQLMRPENDFLSPDLYNQFFTVHGTAMMFLFAIPVMEGIAIYIVPMMVGTRDMAFPRLNAFGYYVYLIGGAVFFGSLLFNIAPAAGWFNYVPLAGIEYSPGLGVGIWTTMITFIEVSALTAAVELIVTILKLRAPGMSLNRMPLFVWSALVTAFMIVFAMPAIIAASSLLVMDRQIGTHIFTPETGGQPLLWQHLFWFFGHPEVYIILMPALGIISTIIPVFTQRPIFGYTALVLSLVATGFIGFGLWVHHMFATGLPQLGMSFFMAASAMIAIPQGIQVFCWIASMWGARMRFDTPLLYVLGFFVIFVVGGISGVMVAVIPFDLQVHDTFFLVAHFHYVLIGGAVFPLIGGMYYWYPKMFGRMMDERLGKISFWLAFIGFNVTFFPMHQLGLQGMPRRIYTYLEELGWGDLNLLATMGSFILAAGFLLSLFNALWSLWRGAPAGEDPWGSPTLEWATPSPPPNYNHAHIPIVSGRYPLWDRRGEESSPVVVGLRDDRREVLVTTVLDAEPHAVAVMPAPTIWPFISAVAASTGFLGILYHPSFFLVGFFGAAATFTMWFWPRRPWRDD